MVKYTGSGKYWLKHLKIHGRKYVETLWFCLFYDKEELTAFSLMCSEQWNVVEGRDESGKKIWANEKPENGIDGTVKGTKFGPQSTEHIAKRAAANIGKHFKSFGPQSEDLKEKKRKAMIGKNKGKKYGPQTPEHIAKRADANRHRRGPYKKPANA